jgi:hypothetical protein
MYDSTFAMSWRGADQLFYVLAVFGTKSQFAEFEKSFCHSHRDILLEFHYAFVCLPFSFISFTSFLSLPVVIIQPS